MGAEGPVHVIRAPRTSRELVGEEPHLIEGDRPGGRGIRGGEAGEDDENLRHPAGIVTVRSKVAKPSVVSGAVSSVTVLNSLPAALR